MFHFLNEKYQSPRWSWEFIDCAMPMTFDTYSNCWYNCQYCFATFQRAVWWSKEKYLKKEVKKVDVERVKRMFSEPDKYGWQFKDYIKGRYNSSRWWYVW